MEWNDLKVFLAIARLGSLSAAAQVLGQTQPTVGRRLKTLEASVKQTLFHRSPDGFRLTQEGLGVLKHAEHVEQEVFAFERELSGTQLNASGVVSISTIDWIGRYLLSPVVRDYLTLHPAMTVQVVAETKKVSLSRREADLAFRLIPFDEPDVIQKKVGHVTYGLYSHRRLPKLARGDGRDANLIAMNDSYSEMPDAVWLTKMFPKARYSYRSNNRDAQAEMCSYGMGYATLPDFLAKRFPLLVKHEYKETPPGRDIWMGYHKDLSRLERLRSFIDGVNRKFAIE